MTGKIFTMCPRSSYQFYIVTYYIIWVTTSWPDSTKYYGAGPTFLRRKSLLVFHSLMYLKPTERIFYLSFFFFVLFGRRSFFYFYFLCYRICVCFFCFFVCLSVCLVYVYLSVCLSVCLSVPWAL